MRGIPSHGAMLIPVYVARLRDGGVSPRPRGEVVHDRGAVAVIDAGNAFGQLTGEQAIGLAVEKARAFGVGVVTVRHAFHFGGAFRYALAAARAGCVAIVAANTRPMMPAPGGADPVVGNNPLAIAAPVAGREPLLLDMATSEAAMGKVRLAAQAGREIPPTWGAGADGRPTTDAAEAVAGMLLPTGGPKGFGLALLLDVLTGVLSGGAFGAGVNGIYRDTVTPNDCAHLFVAIDPAFFGDPEEFAARTAALADGVLASRTAPGADRVVLPGQLEDERAADAGREGVPVDETVLAELERVAAEVGVELAPRPAAGALAGAAAGPDATA
jgi:LDH2 family malate/lactate/ureidoglycolate dehydrogenase